MRGNRIERVAPGSARRRRASGAMVIDGAGATLMPGLVEAHTHFAWNDAETLQDIQRMPTEEHTLWTAGVAKVYLDHGFTSCVGAATAKPRLDVVVRNAINEGLIPGPRYLAASQEITVAGGLGDETLPHIPWPEFSFGVNVSGPEEMRRAVRIFLKYGVDSIKLNLSGDNLTPHADAHTTWMSDEEVAVACREAHMRGKRVAAHARSRRVGEAVRAPRHRGDLPRELHRRGSARPAGEREGPRLRGARAVGDHQAAERGRALRHPAGAGARDGLPARARRRLREPARDEASAASACCPAATTASRGRRTAPTRWTSSTS